VRRKWQLHWAAAAAAAALVAGCGDSGSDAASGGATDGPIQVILSGALSEQGSVGVNANMMVMSAKAAIAEINASGGLLGRQLQATVVDDGGNATTAVTKLQDVVNSGQKPAAFFNSGPSNTSAATLPILNQNGILTFNEAPTKDSADATKYPLSFDMAPAPANSAEAFCPYAKSQGWTKVAILNIDSAYGNPVSAAAKSACEQGGVTVTGTAKFATDALDLTPQLQSLRAGNPQAVIFVGYGAPVGYGLKNLDTIGWDVPVLGDIAVAASQAVSSKPPAGYVGTPLVKNIKFQVFQSTVQGAGAGKPANTDAMVTEIKKQGAIQTSLILAYQYDAVQLFAAAAKKANTVTDAKAIAQALATLGPGEAKTGVFTQYFYTATDHSSNEPPDAFTFVPPSVPVDGQFARS
jgi:branched-chain amino acid transport system substrate-binding protein